MNNKYSEYNVIPIGDNCTVSNSLRDIKIRNKSYPFDWVSKVDHLYDTSIMYHIDIIKKLNYEPISEIVKNYIGNAFNDDNDTKINNNTNMWFPHDEKIDVFSKYERRFNRLKEDLNQKTIFMLLTRHYYIDESTFETIMKELLSHNKESMICFISGTNHEYFQTKKYDKVIFKHIYYDVSKFWQYDHTHFAPTIKHFYFKLFYC
jgi:hypothetical protein